MKVRKWIGSKTIIIPICLITICAAVLSYRYFTGVDRQLKMLLSKWQRGEKIEAIKLYERIVRVHRNVSPISLTEMYATVYRERKDTDPQLAQESKANADRLMEELMAQSPSNSFRLFHFAALYDEYLDEPQRALRLYRRCLPLLESDAKATAEGKPNAAGYMVADTLRAGILKDYNQTAAQASNRVVVLESEARRESEPKK